MDAGIDEANPYASELVNALAKALSIYIEKNSYPKTSEEEVFIASKSSLGCFQNAVGKTLPVKGIIK